MSTINVRFREAVSAVLREAANCDQMLVNATAFPASDLFVRCLHWWFDWCDNVYTMLLPGNVTQGSCWRSLVPLSWFFLLFACRLSAASDEFPMATWKTGSPESQGLDSAVLAEAIAYVRANVIRSEERRV